MYLIPSSQSYALKHIHGNLRTEVHSAGQVGTLVTFLSYIYMRYPFKIPTGTLAIQVEFFMVFLILPR